MAVLDKRTNKTAVISKMNEQDGSIEVVPPDKRTTTVFSNWTVPHLWNCSSRISRTSTKILQASVSSLYHLPFGQDTERGHPDSERGRPRTGRQETGRNSELNDEGRIAKLARRYKFDEHQLPWKDLNALGLDKETLFNNHCMGELLKGRITSTALPISKEINGEKKDLGEACFMCVKGADGKVELKTLTRLDKPQYDLPVYKGVFTDEEKDKLAETGTLGGIKEMKDTLTGNVCKCYVSFHESTNRIITMPVDAIKIPDYIYGKRLDDKQKQILASGGEVPINDIQRKNDTMLSGVAYVDPTIRDIAFKQSDKQLKVSDTILGAKITPEQKRYWRITEWYSLRTCAIPRPDSCSRMMCVSATRATTCS